MIVQAGAASRAALLDSLAGDTRGEVRRLRRNETIFQQGDKADSMFVVRRGRIAVSNCSAEGRESLVGIMEAGEPFGVLGLFDGCDRSVQARALEPSTVLVLPYDKVRRLLEERPHLMWGLVRMVAERLRAVDEALADSVFLDVPGRTAKRLLELAGPADEFLLPVTQEELAAMVGASRERVNKAISAFVRLGWLELHDRHYRFRNRPELERKAQG